MSQHFFIDSLGRTVMRHPIHYRFYNLPSEKINEEDDWFKREENKFSFPRAKHDDLTGEHKSALRQYSKSSRPVNHALISAHEHGHELGAYYSDRIRPLDSVTNRQLGHEHHLYSGLGFHPGEMLKHTKDGVVHLPAYTSMTHDKEIAANFADVGKNNSSERHILHIRVKPTDKGVRMLEPSEQHSMDEKETVLPRGTNLKINPTPEKGVSAGRTYHIWHGEVHSQPEPSTKHLFHSKNEDDINDSYVNHPDRESRIAATFRSTLKPHHIDKLVNDDDFFVRSSFAKQHPNLLDEHVRKLANDDDMHVRMNLSSNPHLKPHQVDSLIRHPDPYVSHSAIASQKLNDRQISSVISDEDKDKLYALSKNPHLKSHQIDKLIVHPNNHGPLAGNKNLEPHHIDALMKNTPNWSIAHTLVIHPNLQDRHITALAKHPDEDIRQYIQKKYPQSKISESFQYSGFAHKLIERVSNDLRGETRKYTYLTNTKSPSVQMETHMSNKLIESIIRDIRGENLTENSKEYRRGSGGYVKTVDESFDADTFVESLDEDQINEISKALLGRYIKSAKDDMSWANAKSVDDMSHGKRESARKSIRQSIKRGSGIDKAVDRLTKEDVDSFLESLDEDQINEISKALLSVNFKRAKPTADLSVDNSKMRSVLKKHGWKHEMEDQDGGNLYTHPRSGDEIAVNNGRYHYTSENGNTKTGRGHESLDAHLSKLASRD